ncbi:MAG TPA: hypothetical protein VL524_06480, partial [Gemmatimonadaceae bacterium]|nr:hypothetical protein [Gemmatimonadaceae bacterium]
MCARVRFAVLVGAERLVVGMRPGVLAREAGDDGIGEDRDAVVGQEIAPVQTLADEQRVIVRVVVVR